MSLTELTLDATQPGAPVAAIDGVAPDTTASRSAMWVVLLGGGLLTGVAMLMMALDPRHAVGWELVHWNVSAVTAVWATALSLRGTSGLPRQIRVGSVVAMVLWLFASLTWLALVVTDSVAFPSISDLFSLLFVAPGAWMLVASVRGRLSRAAEAAVYLDNVLVFLATGAVLVSIFGPTALAIGGWAGFLVVLYPTIFLGAAATSLVGIFSTGQSMRPQGGLAFGVGVGLVGLAFVGWIEPTSTGSAADHPLDLLFSLGPLVAAFGAMTWVGRVTESPFRLRLAGAITWSVGPVAVLIAAIAAATVDETRDIELFLQVLTATSVLLLLVRMSLHLRERGEMLEEVRRLDAANQVLVARLRGELAERERVQARLVDASRMSAVGELAAAVAHEVNNPLTGVLGYTELLLAHSAADAGIRGDLETIRSEALRVRDRVRALIEFASPKRPRLVATDVASVIGGPISLLRYHLQQRGIIIEERHEPMPAADLDAPSIQQVVINIISDLASAMPQGGRLIVASGPAGDHARIMVTVESEELDIAAVAAAFQPFDDEEGDIPGSRRIAASLGVLRGHDATIGLHQEGGRHPRVEIHLPFRSTHGEDRDG